MPAGAIRNTGRNCRSSEDSRMASRLQPCNSPENECAKSHTNPEIILNELGVKNELKSLGSRASGFPLHSCPHRLGRRLGCAASLRSEPARPVPGSSCCDAGLNGRDGLQVHAMAALEREVAKDCERKAICVDYSLAVRFPQGDDGEVAGPGRDTTRVAYRIADTAVKVREQK